MIIAATPLAAAVHVPREMRQSASPAVPRTGVRAELLHDLDDSLLARATRCVSHHKLKANAIQLKA